MDLNRSCGEECKAQLDAEFGEGSCSFIQCDVSNGDALRGETAERHRGVTYTTRHWGDPLGSSQMLHNEKCC